MKDSVRISIYHHATQAWLAWQAAAEAGDSERAEKAFRVYDFGFDLIGRRRPLHASDAGAVGPLNRIGVPGRPKLRLYVASRGPVQPDRSI
jgi:hypothetical protein